MVRVLVSILLLCLFPCLLLAQIRHINADLEVRQLSDKVYVYTAWADMGTWGRVGSNGLIVADGKEAFLVDTPVDALQTEVLSRWITDSLGVRLVSFVPGHWHGDCVGGMEWLNKQGVATYANVRTNAILKSKQRPQSRYSFNRLLRLKVGKTRIECYYLGGGHATDNVVVWLPSEKILFGGCMVKDCSSIGLGNTEDAASLSEWDSTIGALEKRFSKARFVVPGHGDYGGKELFEHTRKLLTK